MQPIDLMTLESARRLSQMRRQSALAQVANSLVPTRKPPVSIPSTITEESAQPQSPATQILLATQSPSGGGYGRNTTQQSAIPSVAQLIQSVLSPTGGVSGDGSGGPSRGQPAGWGTMTPDQRSMLGLTGWGIKGLGVLGGMAAPALGVVSPMASVIASILGLDKIASLLGVPSYSPNPLEGFLNEAQLKDVAALFGNTRASAIAQAQEATIDAMREQAMMSPELGMYGWFGAPDATTGLDPGGLGPGGRGLGGFNDPGDRGGGNAGDGGGSSGTGGCFIAGTEVTNHAWQAKPIESYVAGDRILAWDESKRMLNEGEVAAVFTGEASTFVVIDLESGESITCTPTHRFLATRSPQVDCGWIEAKDLEGGFIMESGLSVERVKEITTEPQAIYNLRVEPYHTYLACGQVVHNVKRYGGVVTTNRPRTERFGERGTGGETAIFVPHKMFQPGTYGRETAVRNALMKAMVGMMRGR